MTVRRTIGNIIAILLACMWTFATQAHFTSRYTPDFAASIDASTKEVHPAFAFSGLSVEQVHNSSQTDPSVKRSQTDILHQLKYFFGTLGLATASLLWLPQTRRLGCRAAASVTFVGRVYSMLVVEGMDRGGLEVVAVSAGAAAVAARLLG